MPKYNKRYNRRYRRRRRRSRFNMKVARPMRPQTFRFKRSYQEIRDMSGSSADGWTSSGNGLYKQFIYQLNMLPGNTDFINLFARYKLTSVSIKMYFSQTVSDTFQEPVTSGTGGGPKFASSQLIMRIAPNPNGASTALPEQYFLETASTKTRLCLNTLGKPLSVYSPLFTLSETYKSSLPTGTAYSAQKPRYISTLEPDVPHYGLNCRLDRADGQPMSTSMYNYQKVRIIHTLYFQCQQVQ